MNSFLITFKPSKENPKRGWPLESLQALVRKCKEGKKPKVDWRFHNRRSVSLGDRVFLLLQGKSGPAIIGYGKTVGHPSADSGQWRLRIKFEAIVDPTTHVLANRDDLHKLTATQHTWGTQISGVLLPSMVASELENLVVGKQPKEKASNSISNPDWTRDELILALDMSHPAPPKSTPGRTAQKSRN